MKHFILIKYGFGLKKMLIGWGAFFIGLMLIICIVECFLFLNGNVVNKNNTVE